MQLPLDEWHRDARKTKPFDEMPNAVETFLLNSYW